MSDAIDPSDFPRNGSAVGAGAARDAQHACGDGAGGTPRLVIRGESTHGRTLRQSDQDGVGVLTDWLNVTFPFVGTEETIQDFVQSFGNVTQGAFGGLVDRGRGLHGYSRSFAFDSRGGLFAFGGQRSTAFLSLSGEGCHWVADWETLSCLLRDCYGARITRWDGAADDRLGRHTVDDAVRLYAAGEFKSGGRQPECSQHGNWLFPDEKGRTFEVGRRSSGKFLRVYEKGKQLGDATSTWVRWEAQFGNKDRIIPWEVLLDPAPYIAGAYPALAWVHSHATRIETIRNQDTISYERSEHFARLQAGRVINVMMQREGEAADTVIEKLRRAGVPSRLAFSDEYLRAHGGVQDV